MDFEATLDTPHPPEALFAQVDDLAGYPAWLDIVRRTTPDGDGAWLVDLRGRLGPLARSKRLRMVRATRESPRHARFERDERDGRRHATWTLDVMVDPTDTGSRLTMRLHYGGGLFGPVLERVLRDEVEQAKPRLLSLLTGSARDQHP